MVLFQATNTRWFFLKAKAMRRRNEILMVKNKQGEWKSSKEDIRQVVVEHFRGIFLV